MDLCAASQWQGNEQPEGVAIYAVPAGGWMLCSPLSSHPTPSLQGYHTIYFRLPGGSERESKLSKVTQPGSSRNEM